VHRERLRRVGCFSIARRYGSPALSRVGATAAPSPGRRLVAEPRRPARRTLSSSLAKARYRIFGRGGNHAPAAAAGGCRLAAKARRPAPTIAGGQHRSTDRPTQSALLRARLTSYKGSERDGPLVRQSPTNSARRTPDSRKARRRTGSRSRPRRRAGRYAPAGRSRLPAATGGGLEQDLEGELRGTATSEQVARLAEVCLGRGRVRSPARRGARAGETARGASGRLRSRRLQKRGASLMMLRKRLSYADTTRASFGTARPVRIPYGSLTTGFVRKRALSPRRLQGTSGSFMSASRGRPSRCNPRRAADAGH